MVIRVTSSLTFSGQVEVVSCSYIASMLQRWPESLFQTPTLLLFQNFWMRVRIWQFFKFDNPTPVQTPARIIDPTVAYPCFYLRNDHTDSCYCRIWKVTPVPVFPKFLTTDPGPKEKCRILPESTPVLRIRSHIWYAALLVLLNGMCCLMSLFHGWPTFFRLGSTKKFLDNSRSTSQ